MARSSKYSRGKPHFDPLPTASYAVEGSVTEVEYINGLVSDRKLGKRFRHIRSHSDPTSIVKALVAEKAKSKSRGERRDYWIAVFDSEFSEERRSNIVRARKIARENGIECVETSPSFEFWLKLHYSNMDRPYGSQKDVEEDLRSYIPDYCKKEGVLKKRLPDLISRVEIACDNARRINTHGLHGNSTEMPNLVGVVNAMRDRQIRP